jgi:transposase
LGVDDWARKRGQTYGTILVDLERHRVVDLLEDRTAASFATWLRAHPGVEVIARDRAGAYADGARQGAPAAVQVADRFHLLLNVGETLERVLARKHALLRETTAAVNRVRATMAEPARDPIVVEPVAAGAASRSLTRDDQEKAAHRAARLARYEAVIALDRQGASQVQIAAQVGIGRKTVRRFLRAGTFPERVPTSQRPSILDPYEPYLRERWAAGCHNSLQLWREIRERGVTGAASLVRRLVGRWRTVPRRRVPPPGVASVPHAGSPPETPLRVPSARQARWFLLHPETRLRPEEVLWRETLLDRDPEIRAARELAQGFSALVRERDHAALTPWLTHGATSALPEFQGFATVLERDRAAVEAALTSEWSSAQTEGQITKLKLQKRQLYGRAGFSLLRKRILRAA